MLPDPLHPAIVHFPIVLLLLGAPLAILAIFLRNWHLPLLTALVLTMGATGAMVATWTGEEEAEVVGELSGTADKILDEHEEWGERARNFGIGAAVLAILSVLLSRVPIAGRVLALLAAIVAIAAAVSVSRAGHYGGLAVYKHGIGVNTAAGAATAPKTPEKHPEKKHEKHHD